MSVLRLSLSAFAILAIVTVLCATESDELRERAKTMQREAAELAERGREQEADRLRREAVGMLEEAERLEGHRPDHREAEMMRLERLLEELRDRENHLQETGDGSDRLADVRREAARVETELRKLSHQHAPHDEIGRRLEHMRIAVEHLEHAGLHDIAQHVAERAEATERELHEQNRRRGDDMMHEIMRQLDELRHEVGRLHGEVNELRKRR